MAKRAKTLTRAHVVEMAYRLGDNAYDVRLSPDTRNAMQAAYQAVCLLEAALRRDEDARAKNAAFVAWDLAQRK